MRNALFCEDRIGACQSIRRTCDERSERLGSLAPSALVPCAEVDDSKGDQSALKDESCKILVLGQQNARLLAGTGQEFQIAHAPFVAVQDLDVMPQSAEPTHDWKWEVLVCQDERQAVGRPLLGGAARCVDLLDREGNRSLNVLERERRVRLDDLRGRIAGREFLEDLRHTDPCARDPGLAGQGVGCGDDCGAHCAIIARAPATRQPCSNGAPSPEMSVCATACEET